jgi:DNA-nicking Smr family endonuclease
LPKLPQSPLNAGDPKRERQVARGKIAIEGVLDLHGMRQDEADRATLRFLGGSLSRGRRVVLIITGKGGFEAEHKGEGRGILRRRFLQGIETGLYGQGISAVRPAHQRHGGQGAFYVFLKSKRHQTKADGVTKSSRRLSMRP